MSKTYSVTSAGQDPATDRKQRMRFYVISMSVRFICVLAIFFTPGWWVLVPIVGAAVLPYLAVAVANNVGNSVDTDIAEKFSPQALQTPQPNTTHKEKSVIIVDVFADRSVQGERIYESARPVQAEDE